MAAMAAAQAHGVPGAPHHLHPTAAGGGSVAEPVGEPIATHPSNGNRISA
jgi:hypothetical protein